MENDLMDVEATPVPLEVPDVEPSSDPTEAPTVEPIEKLDEETALEPTEAPLEDGEAVPEASETPEASPVPTVSGGDSYDFAEMLALTEGNEELLQELVIYEELENMTIWEKPLELWTPTEGCLLILVIVVLFAFVYKIVEGVIRW